MTKLKDPSGATCSIRMRWYPMRRRSAKHQPKLHDHGRGQCCTVCLFTSTKLWYLVTEVCAVWPGPYLTEQRVRVESATSHSPVQCS